MSQNMKSLAPPVIGGEVGGCGKEYLIHKILLNFFCSKRKFQVIYPMILLQPRPLLSMVGYFYLCFYFFFVCLLGGSFPHFKQSTGFSLATSHGVGGVAERS